MAEVENSNNGGESKFGFKDKAKAQETLELLESHDMQYRKLTVRGLLGRAKRVLSMTKAAEKLKNINEAIEVFEHWLEENGGGAANKNSKIDNDNKVDTVPGLGFKDKAAAEQTLKILAGRDPEYQKLAVKGLIGSSKRVLSGTKNDDKIKSIQEGVKILEDFLEKFETENMSRNNRAYLAYSIVEQLINDKSNHTNDLALDFVETYGGDKAKGNYKHLRTMYPKSDETISWDIIRNKHIAKILERIKSEEAKLFNEETGAPTEIHLELISWAYSPQPDKLKEYLEKSAKKSSSKRKSSPRKSEHSDRSSSSDGESPQKKQRT